MTEADDEASLGRSSSDAEVRLELCYARSDPRDLALVEWAVAWAVTSRDGAAFQIRQVVAQPGQLGGLLLFAHRAQLA